MLGFSALAEVALAEIPGIVEQSSSVGSGITGGYFSRKRWHDLLDELEREKELARADLPPELAAEEGATRPVGLVGEMPPKVGDEILARASESAERVGKMQFDAGVAQGQLRWLAEQEQDEEDAIIALITH